MRREHVPESPCPSCGVVLDSRVLTGDQIDAVEADVSVCMECGGPAAFTADLHLRACTHEELLALADDATFQKARGIVLQRLRDRQRRRP